MHTDRLFKPSPYLKARDFRQSDGRYMSTVVVIADVKSVSPFNKNTNRHEDEWGLFFHDKKKCLILNATNSSFLTKHLGTETDDWRGRSIALYVSEGERVAGKTLDVIRIRLPVENPPTTNGHSEPPTDSKEAPDATDA
jgi:hypothetical protein